MSSQLIKSILINIYKKENDPNVKERLLLIIKVREEEKQIPFRVHKKCIEAITGLQTGKKDMIKKA